MTSVKLSDILSPAFADVHCAIKNGEVTEAVLKGGRGSAKSSYASIEVVLQILNNPEIHAVVMRKVANTLRTTVYAQYVWAITTLGLHGRFAFKVSPMEIVYKCTGQRIMFFGADDPGKVKSIKVPFGYIGILHFEEIDQFGGQEEIRNLEQSVLRGGPFSLGIKVFNPPQSNQNWANRYVLQEKPKQIIHHSDYRTTPPEWLGPRFLEDAEYLRELDYHAYEHEYLGVANGTGGNVFNNLDLRPIEDKELNRFDRIYQGVDWGWFPDPYCFLRVHYDRARETIFLIDEIYQNKLTNEESAKIIWSKGYNDARTTCDSAEPKSVADYRAMRIHAFEAVKGPGSVDYGMKWLQRRKIVIDRRRTPNAFREFTAYEYERNKNGEIISGYPDKDNHSIDALRYALEPVFRRMGVVA